MAALSLDLDHVRPHAPMEKGDSSQWELSDVELSEHQTTGLGLLRMSEEEGDVESAAEEQEGGAPLFGSHARAAMRDLKEAWDETH